MFLENVELNLDHLLGKKLFMIAVFDKFITKSNTECHVLRYSLQCKFPYSVQMRHNTGQIDSKYGHFLRRESHNVKAIS